MMTDDEKYLFAKKPYTMNDMRSFVRGNVRDILSVGFDIKKPFSSATSTSWTGNSTEMPSRSPAALPSMPAKPHLASTKGTYSSPTFRSFPKLTIYGSDSVGRAHFVSIQTSSSFATTFPHIFGTNTHETSKTHSLIPCAIDQDSYFRMCRDVAPRLGYAKPSLLHAKFFPARQGLGSNERVRGLECHFTSDMKKQV